MDLSSKIPTAWAACFNLRGDEISNLLNVIKVLTGNFSRITSANVSLNVLETKTVFDGLLSKLYLQQILLVCSSNSSTNFLKLFLYLISRNSAIIRCGGVALLNSLISRVLNSFQSCGMFLIKSDLACPTRRFLMAAWTI